MVLLLLAASVGLTAANIVLLRGYRRARPGAPRAAALRGAGMAAGVAAMLCALAALVMLLLAIAAW